ncbi:MAG: hypothetical protein ABI354_01500 [Candidatus Saccharimonadales bacterium]
MESMERPELITEDQERLGRLVEWAQLDPRYHQAAYNALSRYPDNDFYHNTEHMFDVATGVLEECDTRGLESTERQALFVAALYHDADAHLQSDETHTSPEERSAAIARIEIISSSTGYGCEADDWDTLEFTNLVGGLIISTVATVDIGDGRLEHILNSADLGNLSWSQLESLRSSGRFFVEMMIKEGEAFIGSMKDMLFFADTTGKLDKLCTVARDRLNLLANTKHLPEIVERIKLITPKNVLAAFSNEEQPDS